MTATTVREVPVDPTLAEKLRRAAGKVDTWLDERDRLIYEARKSGGSLREIAEMVGMSHPGVMKVVTRMERDQNDPR